LRLLDQYELIIESPPKSLPHLPSKVEGVGGGQGQRMNIT
jgi:hypothetical protein